MSLTFTHLWQQQDHSDLDVVLTAPADTDVSDQQTRERLASFPGHSALLSNSPVFAAQILRWQDGAAETPPAKKKCTRSGDASGSTDKSSRTQLELELQDASEQPAAVAVLSSLYAIKPLPELLSELSQEQQLQAAVLADKWQVPNISTAAAQLLADAASADGGLLQAVKQHVLSAHALPDCLQPLLKRLLLSMFGDLEAAWATAGLQQQLLGLPLPSMQLLLSCDELKVATEDTVLYTVRQYLKRLEPTQRQHARHLLAPLIRCQHLSMLWLTASVMSDATLPLMSLRPHLKQLVLLRNAKPTQALDWSQLQTDCKLTMQGAPESWQLGQRSQKPVSSVSVTWKVKVSRLQGAAQDAAGAAEGRVRLQSYVETGPLGGVTFTPFCDCSLTDAGVEVGLFARANNVPDDVCVAFKFRLDSAGVSRETYSPLSKGSSRGYGWDNFYAIGPMAGGWDEAI